MSRLAQIARRVVVAGFLLAALTGMVGGSAAHALGVQAADPQAWGELSADEQDAVLEFLAEGTPAESTTYATTPESQAGAQALEAAFVAARPADAGTALVADAGTAAQQAKLVPTPEDVVKRVGPRTINPTTALCLSRPGSDGVLETRIMSWGEGILRSDAPSEEVLRRAA